MLLSGPVLLGRRPPVAGPGWRKDGWVMWSWPGEEGVESPRTEVWGRKREAMMILLLRSELIAAYDEGIAVAAVLGGEDEYLCHDQFSIYDIRGHVRTCDRLGRLCRGSLGPGGSSHLVED